MKQAFTKLFCVGHQFRFQFPESFSTVPAVEAANQVWGEAADITEVVEQLKGERDNKGLSAVPDSVLRCFNAIVGLATEKIAKLQQRLKDNEHHLGTASKAKAGDKIPSWLKLEVPRINFFENDIKTGIEVKFRQRLNACSRELLDLILEERMQLQLKLVEEAERLSDELKEEAMQLWMEQGHWNAWDKLYPVQAVARQDDGRGEEIIKIPLSTVVFFSAMYVSRGRASAQSEAAREEQAEKARSRKKEQSLRREVLAHVSAATREDAEKSIEQRMRDIIQPLSTRLGKLESALEGNPSIPTSISSGRGTTAKSAKRLREPEANPSRELGNAQAPMAADPFGDASQSAEQSHLTKANQDPSEKPIAASNSEKRKKKWKKDFKKGRRAHGEGGHADQPTNQDQARRPGQGSEGNLLVHVHRTFTDGRNRRVPHVTP